MKISLVSKWHERNHNGYETKSSRGVLLRTEPNNVQTSLEGTFYENTVNTEIFA